jgi:hypothetical protein
MKQYVGLDESGKAVPEQFHYWVKDSKRTQLCRDPMVTPLYGQLQVGDPVYVKWAPNGRGVAYWWKATVISFKGRQKVIIKWARCECQDAPVFEDSAMRYKDLSMNIFV